jgi:hypothetical protein
MSALDIIAAMGGKHDLAALTGAKPNAVTQWRRIGIPSRYWHVLVEEAARRGIEGITFDALAASKPGAAQDAAA